MTGGMGDVDIRYSCEFTAFTANFYVEWKVS